MFGGRIDPCADGLRKMMTTQSDDFVFTACIRA